MDDIETLYPNIGNVARGGKNLILSRAFLMGLILFSLTLPAFPQEALWKELNGKALKLYQQGQYTEAVKASEEALRVAEKTFGENHPNVAESAYNLAASYKAKGKYAEAEPLYNRALSIDEAAFGRDHPLVATDLNNLALLYKTQGRYADEEPLYERALAIREKALSPKDPGFTSRRKAHRIRGGSITTPLSCYLPAVVLRERESILLPSLSAKLP